MARRRKTWRFRLNDATTLEVSASDGLTEKQVRRRGRWSLILGTLIAAVMLVAVASGDNVVNTLDTTVDATNESMNLTAGGATGSTYVWVENVNVGGGDTNNACNLAGAASLTVNVQSADTTVATVSPSTVTVDECSNGDTSNATELAKMRQITVTPVSAGTANVTFSQNSFSGSGTFDYSTAAFTVNVSAPPAPSDTTPPSVTAYVNPAPNAAGWNNSTPVALTWTITDSESATSIVSGCVDESFTSETAGVTRSCTASSAGGTTGPVSVTIKIDTTKPVITGTTGSYVLGTWTNQSVTVSFACADTAGTANSGIASSNVAGATLTTSGADQSVTNTGTCTDTAGNVANSVTVNNIDIDKVAPTVACNAASFLLNEPGAQVSATVTDALSGSVNTTEYGTADTSSVGQKSVSITGYDNAGNSKTESCSYIVGYNFAGLFAPIDRPNIMNVSKAGQALPLKWRLTDYFGNGVTNLASAVVTVTGISCLLGTSTDLVEEVPAGSSGLQNLGDGYYQINWKSPTSYANSCKKLNLNLGEGSTRSDLAFVSFKK